MTGRFWRKTTWLSRLALITAAIGALAHIATFSSISPRGALGAVAFIHLVILALGVALVMRIIRHNWLAIRTRHAPAVSQKVPRWLAGATVLSFAYLLALFILLLAAYGEGGPELRNGLEVWIRDGRIVRELPPGSIARFDMQMLRIFSAAWLAFGLMIASVAHHYGERIRSFEEQRRRAAA